MENNSLAFLTSLGGKLSGKEAGGAKLAANADNTGTDRNGFFAILNRLLTPNENANENALGQPLGIANHPRADELLSEAGLEGLDAMFPPDNVAIATTAADVIADDAVSGLAPVVGDAPIHNVSNAGEFTIQKANAAAGEGAIATSALKAVQTATLAPDDKPVLEPGAGPRSENANDQAFMAPRQGANKPFAQGQNPVAIAAKSIGETMKAEHAVAAPVTDIDAPVAERAISRADAVSVAADKSVSINPVRDQVLAALVSRHGEGRLEVRLDPPELGRVMIRFEGDGGELVRAVISADTPETLDLMRRNADAFHKSLAEQGFEGLDLQFTEHGAKDASDEEFEAEKTFIAANELERAAGLEEHDATGRMVALGRLDRRL